LNYKERTQYGYIQTIAKRPNKPTTNIAISTCENLFAGFYAGSGKRLGSSIIMRHRSRPLHRFFAFTAKLPKENFPHFSIVYHPTPDVSNTKMQISVNVLKISEKK